MKAHTLVFMAMVSLSACASRPSELGTTIDSPVQTVGLHDAVAIADASNRRIVVVAPGADAAEKTYLPFGGTFRAMKATKSGSHVLVLSGIGAPGTDEAPRLSVYARGGQSSSFVTYTLPSGASQLAVDPTGRYVVVYSAEASGATVVENPNELTFVDLTLPPGPANPSSRTLRSFGGRPSEVVFSPELTLPSGKRRLLVVLSSQDVTLLDLDHVFDATPRPEITVRLASGTTSRVLSPVAVAFDDGDALRSDDAVIAIRTANDTSVITLELGTPPPEKAGSGNDFYPIVNMTDVGGIVSDIGYATFDAGTRLYAMVPSKREVVLVDGRTSQTEAISLPSAYSRASVVGSGHAVLWGSNEADVSLWSLARVATEPYRSTEVFALAQRVRGVFPMASTGTVLLQGSGSEHYVLRLDTRTIAPLSVTAGANMTPSADGKSLWVYAQGQSSVGSVDASTLHSKTAELYSSLDAFWDVRTANSASVGVAISSRGGVSVTVFRPSDGFTYASPGILLEGLR